jgi:hypothetical protein
MNESNHDDRGLHLSLSAFELLREYLDPSNPRLIQFIGITVWYWELSGSGVQGQVGS